MTKIACVGGFLGSGKTTAIIQAARTLLARGFGVGIITNDQGHHLVDTALVRSQGFQAEEIGGGCFCCRFSEFAANARRLAEQSKTEVILAEAVGSCTDLSATVCRRLQQYHSSQFTVAPLTVMVDPSRVREMLCTPSPFNEDVRYLFEKQLAEADRVILTKGDLLSDEEIEHVRAEIDELAGDAPVSVMSGKTGMGVGEWVDMILTGQAADRDLQLDYEIYGAAEASLGWLNANFDLVATEEFSSMHMGEALIARIQEACQSSGGRVAHVKIMVITSEGSNWIALTGSEVAPAWGDGVKLPASRDASLIINARVCAPPEQLQEIVENSVRQITVERQIRATVCHIEAFSPLPPKPPMTTSVFTEN